MITVTPEENAALIAATKTIVDSASFETTSGETIYPMITALVKSKTLHKIAQIALASLEADTENKILRIARTCGITPCSNAVTAVNLMADKIKESPPLAVMQPVVPPKPSTWEDYVYEADAVRKAELMNELRDQFIEAIRAAGGSVKE